MGLELGPYEGGAFEVAPEKVLGGWGHRGRDGKIDRKGEDGGGVPLSY